MCVPFGKKKKAVEDLGEGKQWKVELITQFRLLHRDKHKRKLEGKRLLPIGSAF